MAVARTPRSRWVEEGLLALAAGGPDAVRVESLALALGVTKGGFYGYFADRAALLAEILDCWERDMTLGVIDRVEAGGGDDRERLRRLFTMVTARGRRTPDITTDLAVRDWARRDRAVATRLRRADNRRMDYLRSRFTAFCADDAEAEARAMIAFSVWIGNHFIAADHGSRSRADVLGLVLDRLLA